MQVYGPPGEDFGQTGLLVRRLVFWLGQDVDIAEFVNSRQTCQRSKMEHGASAASSIPFCCRRGAAV